MRVLIFGTFDHLHPGHKFLLEAAEKHGELFVVVAHDKTVRKIKGFLPEQNQEERRSAIEELYPRVTVIFGDKEDYLVPVRKVAPDRILLGYDQKLPPGIHLEDLPCPTKRMEAFQPEKHKSSHRRSAL